VKLDRLREEGAVSEQDQADLCAGFQAACVEALSRVTMKAMALFRDAHPQVAAPVLAVAGGVAANRSVRAKLEDAAAAQGWHVDDLTLAPRPRWPLDETATPVVGYGKRGAKA